MKRTIYLFTIAFVLLLSSCSPVKKATAEADAQAKTLSATEEKALIYIVRPNFLGTAIRFKVYCDEKYIGATSGQRFIYTLQDPGMHLFMSKAENKSTLDLEVEAGKIYYIEQVPTMGFLYARNRLKLLNDVEGKEKLDKCTLSAENAAK